MLNDPLKDDYAAHFHITRHNSAGNAAAGNHFQFIPTQSLRPLRELLGNGARIKKMIAR